MAGKISAMTAAAVGDLGALTSDFEVSVNVTTVPLTRRSTLGTLATWLATVGFLASTITATAFAGPLTGNVTGNVSGSSGSCTGNAVTATTAGSATTAATVTGAAQAAITSVGQLTALGVTGTITGGATGTAFTALQGTAKAGADAAAGDLTIQANLSTSAGAPGRIVFAGGQVLTTGSVVQTPANIISIFQSATATAIAFLKFEQATARIVGGSTNGLAIRNSGNTQDNFSVTDAGTAAMLSNGTQSVQLSAVAASAERFAGGIVESPTGTSIYIAGRNVIGSVAGILYSVAGVPTSAAEVVRVAAGFSTLSLMKSGGVVAIGNNSTGTADNLTIAGSAYGAGVASLRLNGLTTAATNNLVGTLTNSPVTGNPTFWMPVSIAGVIKYIPCF